MVIGATEKSKIETGSVRVARGCHFTWGGGIRDSVTEETFDLRRQGSPSCGHLGKVFSAEGAAGAVTQYGRLPGMFEKQQEGSSGWNGLNNQRVGRRRSERQ